MEDADNYKSRYGMPSNQTLREICAMFCKIVEESGYYVGVYASQSWFNNQLNGSELNPYSKWLAQWPTSGGVQKGLSVNPDSKSGVNLWQFTSQAKFNGYNGNLDANYAYIDFPKIIGNLDNTPGTSTPINNTPNGSTLDLAYRVMKGEFGDGETRKNALGSRYNEVQDFINHIYNANTNVLVEETKSGKYGNNPIRETVLGSRYREVQDIINGVLDRTYTVVPGDTLSEIGKKLGVNWENLALKNNIDYPYTIRSGQILKY